VTNSSDKTITVSCTGAQNKVLGGGYQISGVAGADLQRLSVLQSYPSGATSWTVQGVETSPVNTSWTLTAYAVCGAA
jgi:hypothetical protein